MKLPGRRTVAAVAMTLVAAVVLSGCGEAPHTQTVTVTKTAPTTHATTTQTKLKPHVSSGTARGRRAALTACDPNVRVKAATTTCGFAENVFYEYWHAGEGTAIKAFSAAIGTYLAVHCKAGVLVTCRTGAGALVRFPVRAVRAYTAANARSYARRHTVSGDPDATAAPDPPSSGDAQDCDPSYEGACLDPSAAATTAKAAAATDPSTPGPSRS